MCVMGRRELGWEDYEVVDHLMGQELEGMTTQHPYLDRDLLVGLADYVTADAGTGLVHTAPGYGDDDYNFGKKYDLPIFAPINDQGVLTKENIPIISKLTAESVSHKAKVPLTSKKGNPLEKPKPIMVSMRQSQ